MIESTAISRELGARLRECRERAGLKSVDVARKLGWPQSKVSRLETGDRRCDPMDLSMYLGTCDVHQEIARTLIKLAQHPETGFWTQPYREQLPDRMMTLVMNETTATSIYNFEATVIPGLLQTRNYAAAVFRSFVTFRPEDIEPLVHARMLRQKVLKGPNAPEVTFFINESVLRIPACGCADMTEQLLHLVFMTSHLRVTIRVVPTSAGMHAAMRGPFMFLAYRDRKPVIYLEGEAVTTFVEDREVVEIYRAIRSELHRIALDEEESRRLLADLASEYERVAEERDRDGRPDHLA